MCSGNCVCNQKRVATCGSSCEVKLEQSIPPASSMIGNSRPTHGSKLHGQQYHQLQHYQHHQALKLENNNVKCQSCSVEFQQRRVVIGDSPTMSAVEIGQQQDQQVEHVTYTPNYRVKCESDYKCEIFKCEQCMKEAGQLAIMEMDKDSGILDGDAGNGKLQTVAEVKEEVNPLVDSVQWKKPNYEAMATEPIVENKEKANSDMQEDKYIVGKGFKRDNRSQQYQKQRCQNLSRRKLSLDSLSDFTKIKKINKRTLSVGSPSNFAMFHQISTTTMSSTDLNNPDVIEGNKSVKESPNMSKKKLTKKETENHKRKYNTSNLYEIPLKKSRSASTKIMASDTSIMETINNVIQQSLQMSQKSTKVKKVRSGNNCKIENNIKDNVNLLSTIKCASKKLDIVKAVVSKKLGLIRNEIKNSRQKFSNKMDTKLKCKMQAVKIKNSKIKSKLIETKNNYNKKLLEIKNKKILEASNINNTMQITNKISNAEISNEMGRIAENKNDNKILEPKHYNKIFETKNKVSQIKNVNKVLEIKINKNKNQDGRESKETKNLKEFKEMKEIKSVDITTSAFISDLVSASVHGSSTSIIVNSKDLKARKFKARLQKAIVEVKKSKKKTKGIKKSIERRENLFKIEEQINEPFDKSLSIPRKSFLKPKWSNGWSWNGDAFEAKVYLTNEESAIRRCYVSMKHESGDVLRPLDCVLLKSGPRKADLPFVAKIAALWENPDDGEMMFSLLWYYRPEHTEQGRADNDTIDEVFASRHRDANSVACIEDKCYILTFNEYCRYRKNLRRIEEGLDYPGLIVPPGDQLYHREVRQPPIPVPPDMVLFCRRVYDYRSKKLVKNPG